MRIRLSTTDRKAAILEAAVYGAEKHGYTNITRNQIAEYARCSPALVSNYFNTMIQMRRAIMRSAIREKNLKIIAQGLVAGDPQAKKAPDALRSKAAQFMAG